MVTFEDFKKVEIKVGKILSAEKIPDTDKLLKLSVSFGLKSAPTAPVGVGLPPSLVEGDVSESDLPLKDVLPETNDIRQIVSGIALYFRDPQILVGKKCMFVTNLEPRMIKGHESHGMLFAVSTEGGKFSLLQPSEDIEEGTIAK